MIRFIKVITDALFIAGLIIAGLFLAGHVTGHTPFSAFIVSSGSMEPAIHTGSVVIVAPESSYRVGDVITFYTGTEKKSTTTHRLIAVGSGLFKVAGDANNQPDPVLVDTKNIIGSVRFSIPYLGYLAAFAKTPRGFILLVIVPATIIIYEELKSLLSELKVILTKLKKNNPLGTATINSEWPKFLQPIIILPIFFALLIPLTLSISYFVDRETSSGNTLTVIAPTPTPTPVLTPPARTINVINTVTTSIATASAVVSPPLTSVPVLTPTEIPLSTAIPSPAPL